MKGFYDVRRQIQDKHTGRIPFVSRICFYSWHGSFEIEYHDLVSWMRTTDEISLQEKSKIQERRRKSEHKALKTPEIDIDPSWGERPVLSPWILSSPVLPIDSVPSFTFGRSE